MINQKILAKRVDNSLKGFRLLEGWLLSLNIEEVHACLESTGVYSEKIAEFLYDKGYKVSVVNPLRIKKYAESKLERNKTGRVDARTIADFCCTQEPGLWIPPSKEVKYLQYLTRRIEALEKMITMETNRLESAPKQLHSSIERIIKSLEKEIGEVRKLIKRHFDDHPQLNEQKKICWRRFPGLEKKQPTCF